MSAAASSDADARALAALLGTELGAALMQGGMQVLMLPPRKEPPPLGDSEKGGDFSTPSEAAARPPAPSELASAPGAADLLTPAPRRAPQTV